MMISRKSAATLKAKLAFESERFDDMADFMRQALQAGGELNGEERAMLTIAYKSVLTPRWKTIKLLLGIETSYFETSDVQKEARDYRRDIEREVVTLCRDLISTLEGAIDRCCSRHAENKIFYLMLKADHLRYLAGLECDKTLPQITNSANQAYEEAHLLANSTMRPTNVTRLNVVLSYTIFLEEVLDARHKAIEISRHTFTEAMAGLKFAEESSVNEAISVLQKIYNNLELWSSTSQQASP